tara:strand:+ start:218 stop:403 length:186 start_codon:yes stop_codon:yes gene_type:complete
MNDKYSKNTFSKKPMATRTIEINKENILQYSWIDRLITNMYIALSASLLVITMASLASVSG